VRIASEGDRSDQPYVCACSRNDSSNTALGTIADVSFRRAQVQRSVELVTGLRASNGGCGNAPGRWRVMREKIEADGMRSCLHTAALDPRQLRDLLEDRALTRNAMNASQVYRIREERGYPLAPSSAITRKARRNGPPALEQPRN
jgi:hypothetical protein